MTTVEITEEEADKMIREAKTVSPTDWDEIVITHQDGSKRTLWWPINGGPKLFAA